MNKIKKLVSIIIVFAVISYSSYGLLNSISYADDEEGTTSDSVNETTNPGNQNTNNQSNGKTKKSTPTKTPTKTTTKNPTISSKSGNANLSNLGIKPNDFTGFNPATTTYSVEVENNVTSVEVYAKVADSKSQISGTGIKELSEGNNALSVTVTAENGTTKTYTVNVTRKASTEKQEEQIEENKNEKLGLSKLVIEGAELSPSFKSEVYEYSAKYIGDSDELNIIAQANKEGANVEITGNEKLVIGENLINILVSDNQGNTYTYQVTLNKSLVDENAQEAKRKEEQMKRDTTRALCIGISIIIILIIIIILVIHKLRNMKDDEEDEYVEDIPDIKEKEMSYVNSILQTNLAEKKQKSEEEKQEESVVYGLDNEYEEKTKRKTKGKRFK